MILQIVDGLKAIAEYAALVVILLGLMWLIYGSYEANRRKSWRKLTKVDDWDWDVTKFLKILTICGYAVGIFAIIVGISGLILDVPPSKLYAIESGNDGRHLFTSIFLIVLGLFTFMKPLNDLPIASIVGILAASAICLLIVFLIPDGAVAFIGKYINPKLVMIILFLIIFAIVAITVKFYTAGLMFISKIISWPPLAFIIAIFCIIQGFALIVVGSSIVG